MSIELQTTSLAQVAADDWNARLSAFPQRTPFHRREWIELIAGHFGLRPLLVSTEAGLAESLWPLLVQRKGPLRVVGSPLPGWCTAYLGPLFAEGALPSEAIAAVQRSPILRRASYAELRIVDPHDEIDLQPLGWTRQLRFDTPRLSLAADEATLWQGLDKSCRNAVRRAERAGYEVLEETDAAFVPEFLAMSRQVFARWQLTVPYDERLVYAAWGAMAASGLLRAYSARSGERRACTVVVLRDERTACYLWAATDDADRSHSPNNLVLWHAIREAQRSGRQVFDFVSASGTAGRFKQTFGPTVVPFCTHWTRARSAVEGWLKDAYASLQRWKRSL